MFQQLHSWALSQRNKKLRSYKNLHTHVYCSFIHSNPKLEATQIQWVNKPWHIHTIECYSATKRKKLLIHATICTNLEKLIEWEGKKNQSQEVTYYMVPLI